MLLRRLEIQGFKSFPDKTVVEFGPGISAIVGPNGSGKSNITDAIRWVVGEVSARALRGLRMEDVIFAGTSARRAVPLAEVTLVLDNTDGTLPLPFAEVSVTRRLDRAAAGEYLINRAPCRLRDVQELFAGTGLGRNAFAIVSQGEADEALRARPAERRAMVEEAAGVTRHRARLQEGQRRLATAGAHHERVGDLLAERQRALSHLADQAERADRHARMAAELRGLELSLWAREWRGAERERATHSESALATQAEYDAMTLELAQLAEAQRGLGQQEAQCRTAAEAAQAELVAAERQLEQARQRALLAHRLGMAGAQEAERADARASELGTRLAELEQAAATAAERQEAAGRLAATREVERHQASLALEAAAGQRRAAADAHGAAQAELAAARQARIGTGDDGGLAQAEAALATAQQRAAAATRRAQEAQTALAAAEAAIAPLQARHEEARACVAALRQHHTWLSGQASTVRGRVRALEEMAATGAGYAQGPRTVLAGRARGDAAFAGVLGALGELLEVPTGLAAAIAAALGGAVGDLVAASAQAAAAAIAALRARRGGRATFLPLDQLRPQQPTAEQRQLATAPGVVGWAAELVAATPEVRPAVMHVLGRVLVAEDLEVARRLARQSGFRLRIVTLEGDVVHPGGAMSGGATVGERAGGLVGRDQERRQWARLLDAIAADARQLEAGLAHAVAAEERAGRDLAAARQAVAAAAADARGQREAGAMIGRDLRAAQERHDTIARALAARGQVDPDALARRVAEAEAAVGRRAAEVAAAEFDEARCREAETAARVAQAAADQELRAARQEGERLARELAEFGRRRQAAEEERARAQSQVALHAAAEATAEAEAVACQRELAGAEERLRVAREARAAAEVRVRQAAERREWATAERERLASELRRAEAALARAETALAQVAARLEMAYALTPEALLGVPEPEGPVRARERAAELRRDLAAMGGVRPEAVAEHAALAAEVAALTAAAEDIRSARALLGAWAEDLEAAIAARYTETLGEVRRQFAAIYTRLCGGGRADLVEVEQAEPVRAGTPAVGVEIVAQPPGKQLAHLGLLSGGERTLVAVALVFAFLRVRPTAFCVLDEIEAALDEANVGRCAAFLAEIAQGTQVIAVTHQKGTMETADRLVGVTMSEPGVSRLLSVRLAG